MKAKKTLGIALIAIAGLSSASPCVAQTPDAGVGAVVVETQKPRPRTAPATAAVVQPEIIVVGGRNRPVPRPPKKTGADTTVPAKSAVAR